MEYEQLVEVAANPDLPRHLLIEALLHRLRLKERPSQLDVDGLPIRFGEFVFVCEEKKEKRKR